MTLYKAILLIDKGNKKKGDTLREGYINEYILRDALELDGYLRGEYKIQFGSDIFCK